MDDRSYCLTIADVANLLGITKQGVSQLFKNKGAVKESRKLTYIKPVDIRNFLENSRNYKYNKQVIAFQLIKGGVGKSSLSKNIAIRASMYGYRTLLIDFDHQLNLTISMDAFNPDKPVWIDYLTKKVKDINELVVPINDYLSIIPSSPTNCNLDKEILLNGTNLNSLIAEPLAELSKNYDLIICDCPPALSMLTKAIYLAVDKIIAPIKPDIYSKIGLEQVFQQWNDYTREYRKKPDINILVNLYDPRMKASTEYLKTFFAEYSEYMIPNLIKYSAGFVSTMEGKEHLWSKKNANSTAAEETDVVVKYILNLFDLNLNNSKKQSENKEAEVNI